MATQTQRFLRPRPRPRLCEPRVLLPTFVRTFGLALLVAIGAATGLTAAGLTVIGLTPAAGATPPGSSVTVAAPPDAATNPNGELNALSCASVGNCVGVGTYVIASNVAVSMRAAEVDGTWQPAVAVAAPSPGTPQSGAALNGVSCRDSEDCVAVGSFTDGSGTTQPMTVSEVAGTWQAAVEAQSPSDRLADGPSVLHAVTCPGTGTCTAVGSYTDGAGATRSFSVTQLGGTWQPPVVLPVPSGAVANSAEDVLGVSCPAVGACTAVGSYGVSEGLAGFVVSGSGASWGQADEITPPGNAGPFLSGSSESSLLKSVSCTGSGACVAVGQYGDTTGALDGMITTEVDGAWSAATEISAPADLGAYAPFHTSVDLDGVSCVTVGTCAAVGSYSIATGAGTSAQLYNVSLAVTETNGSWQQGTRVEAPAGGAAGLNAVVCATTTSCEAVGGYDSDPGNFAMAAQIVPTGYREVASDGGIFGFGTLGSGAFFGSMGGRPLDAPIVGIAATPDDDGYWEVASDGGIFSFGSATFYGSMGGRALNRPIVGMAAAPDGHGYWEVASDGGIFSFGSAQFYGSMGGQQLNRPIVGMAAAPDGHGYWEVASDGGIFSFGSARFYGSMGGRPLNRPIVGMAGTPDGHGYWEVASDGGIFTFGNAGFDGSMGGKTLDAPVVGMAARGDGSGYWEVASDGGVFNFGTAPFLGSMGATRLNEPVVGIAGT